MLVVVGGAVLPNSLVSLLVVIPFLLFHCGFQLFWGWDPNFFFQLNFGFIKTF